MAYKITAAARDAYTAIDCYLYAIRQAGKDPKRVYVTTKQRRAISEHLTRLKREQTKDAAPVQFTEYKGCEVVVYDP